MAELLTAIASLLPRAVWDNSIEILLSDQEAIFHYPLCGFGRV